MKKIIKKTKQTNQSKQTKTALKKEKLKGYVIVNRGIEDVAKNEIKELIGKLGTINNGIVLFDIESLADLAILAYKGQSFSRVVLLLDEFNSTDSDLAKIVEPLEKTNLVIASELASEIEFAARCTQIGTHTFLTNNIERAIGEIIYKTYPKVNLTKPNVVFFTYIVDQNFYFGIDFSGEIDKREYRIYSTPKELKATIAYSLLKIAGVESNSKKSILDPFCGSSTIPIEAALYLGNISPRFYDKKTLAFTKFDKFSFDFKKYDKEKKASDIFALDSLLHNSKISEKNAKVAGVNKLITFSKMDIEWLDTKFDKSTVDFVCSWPLEVSKINSEKDIKKIYKEFFYQMEFILKKSGKMCFISRNPDLLKLAGEEYGFFATHERKVMQGQIELPILVFEKKAKNN